MNELMILEKLDSIENLVRTSKNVLSREEASDYTGIAKSYLYKLIAKGEIPFSKPRGKRIYFSREKLDDWLLSNQSISRKEIESEVLDYTIRNRNPRY